MAIRVITEYQDTYYSMGSIPIDLSRKTGVLIRQSRKGADASAPESRLKQESLVPAAVQLRGDTDDSNVILYDEGSGISGTKGYDERPKLSRLYQDIANDIVGSVVVARADRLFRDKHFVSVSMFTKLAEKKRILVIVPGKVVYDFTKTRDLQAFQREMQEAWNYLATQVAYMHDTRRVKIQRGKWGGGNVIFPYVIERAAWKENQAPVIYEPWRKPAIELFQRFQEFGYSISKVARYVESRPYIFPLMPPLDAQRYLIRSTMVVRNGGYTFGSFTSLSRFFSNLALVGYAKVGEDESGPIYLSGAWKPAIPIELFGPAHASITGSYIDGTPYEGRKRRVRSTAYGETTTLLHGLIMSPQGVTNIRTLRNAGTNTFYQCRTTSEGSIKRNDKLLWQITASDLDKIVVDRFQALARSDPTMGDRMRAYWNNQRESAVTEAEVLNQQIESAEAQRHRLDEIIMNPAVPLPPETQSRYLERMREVEDEITRLRKKRDSAKPVQDPELIVPHFYAVLRDTANEWHRLDLEQKKLVVRQIISEVSLQLVSQHIMILRIAWQAGMTSFPDHAIIWKPRSSRQDNLLWLPEEDDVLRRIYLNGTQMEIMAAFPNRTYHAICDRARYLGLHQAVRGRYLPLYRTMSYQDATWVDTVSHGGEDEREFLQSTLNQLAKSAKNENILVHWVVPVQDVVDTGGANRAGKSYLLTPDTINALWTGRAVINVVEEALTRMEQCTQILLHVLANVA